MSSSNASDSLTDSKPAVQQAQPRDAQGRYAAASAGAPPMLVPGLGAPDGAAIAALQASCADLSTAIQQLSQLSAAQQQRATEQHVTMRTTMDDSLIRLALIEGQMAAAHQRATKQAESEQQVLLLESAMHEAQKREDGLRELVRSLEARMEAIEARDEDADGDDGDDSDGHLSDAGSSVSTSSSRASSSTSSRRLPIPAFSTAELLRYEFAPTREGITSKLPLLMGELSARHPRIKKLVQGDKSERDGPADEYVRRTLRATILTTGSDEARIFQDDELTIA